MWEQGDTDCVCVGVINGEGWEWVSNKVTRVSVTEERSGGNKAFSHADSLREIPDKEIALPKPYAEACLTH